MEEEQAEREERKPFINMTTALIALLAVIIVCAFAYFYRTAIQPWEIMNGAVKGLRKIGSAQLAYELANNRKDFGALRTLQKHGDIPKDVTEKNIIPGYYLKWNVHNYTGSPAVDYAISYFTIVAYPYHPRDLKTFAVTDDLDVLVYDPAKSNDPNALHTWEIAQKWVWPTYPN